MPGGMLDRPTCEGGGGLPDGIGGKLLRTGGNGDGVDGSDDDDDDTAAAADDILLFDETPDGDGNLAGGCIGRGGNDELSGNTLPGGNDGGRLLGGGGG